MVFKDFQRFSEISRDFQRFPEIFREFPEIQKNEKGNVSESDPGNILTQVLPDFSDELVDLSFTVGGVGGSGRGAVVEDHRRWFQIAVRGFSEKQCKSRQRALAVQRHHVGVWALAQHHA